MEKEKVLSAKFIIMAIICICLLSVVIVPKGLQNDTFYTIKLGELILKNGIDMQEHFAWHEGLPYTYPHWLYDVGLYFISNNFGYTGLYVSSIVFAAILGIAIYLTNTKLTKNVVIPFFTTILIMYVGNGFMTARAQLITFILFVLTIYFIERFLETKKKRYAIGLLIIPTLIANIHAAVFPFYFVLYLPYIGEFVIKKILDSNIIVRLLLKIDEINIKSLKKKKELNEKQVKELETLENRVEKNKIRLETKEEKEPYKIYMEDNKNMKWLLLIFVLAAFTGLLTPIGDTPYTYLYHTMKGTTTNNISEHLPIVLYNTKAIFGYLIIFISILTFTKVKIKLSDLFLFGGLAFLTIMSTRQQSMLLFVGIIVVNRMIQQLIEMYDKNGIKEILPYITNVFFRVFVYSIFIIVLVIQVNKNKDVQIVNEKTYPVKAAEYINENLDKSTMRLFNEYNFGSYLLYKDIPVFIDSRADVYDPAFNGWEDDIFGDFISLMDANGYEEKFEHYKITHLLIYKNSNLDKVLQKDWNYKELYSDSNFILYHRLK